MLHGTHCIHHNVRSKIQFRESSFWQYMIYRGGAPYLCRSWASSCIRPRCVICAQVTWLPSPRSEAQASGWCCRCSTLLQIVLIFSVTWGLCRLSVTFFHSVTCIFCVPRAFFVALYWPILQFYVCVYTYRSFVGKWHTLASVVTTLYYVQIVFHRRVWYCTLSPRYVCIRSSGIILIPYATFVPNFVSFAASIAELTHGEKSHTQSINQ